MTLQKTQDPCGGEDGLQRDGFEQGIAFIFQWVAMFLAVGEFCVILLRELLKTLPRGKTQQMLTIIQLETCLALPFHSEPSPTVEEISLKDDMEPFVLVEISPDILSVCKQLAGVMSEDIPQVKDIAPPSDVIPEESHSNGVLSPPKEKKAYIPKPRKKPPVKPPSTKKGFG